MKTHQKILSAAIASLLLTGAVVPSIADDLEDELQDIQGQIDESRSSQESWQQVIEDVAVKLKAIQADLDAANARLKSIQDEQAKVNAEIRQTEEEIRKAQAYLEQRQKVLNLRVRSIYKFGQLNYLEVIMGAKSFSDFANRLELLKRIIQSDSGDSGSEGENRSKESRIGTGSGKARCFGRRSEEGTGRGREEESRAAESPR